jgi:hypothetical protein
MPTAAAGMAPNRYRQKETSLVASESFHAQEYAFLFQAARPFCEKQLVFPQG